MSATLLFASCKRINDKRNNENVEKKTTYGYDKEPPIIEIIEPVISRGLVVVPTVVRPNDDTKERIIVKGKITDKSPITFLQINEVLLNRLDKEQFEVFIKMPEDRKISILAKDSKGNEALKVIEISDSPIKEFEPTVKRAYLIGNSNYTNGIVSLRNPQNDVDALGAKLGELGFIVHVSKDASTEIFRDDIASFMRGNNSGSVNIFYYAGHGLQFDGENFLIPIDAGIPETEEQLRQECISINEVFKTLNSDNTVNIVILDACRDNPFKSLESSSTGFAPIIQPPIGTFVAFSADANQGALDGTGNNSVYTSALIENLSIPNLLVEEMFKKTRIKVSKETSGKQEPTEYTKLDKNFYFYNK